MSAFTGRWLWVGLAILLLQACANSNQRGKQSGPNQSSPAAANTQLAISYFERGQQELALEKIERALREDPRSEDAHTVAGYINESIGRLKQAEKHYATALRLAPNNGDVLNNYGQFLCKTDRVQESLSYYQRAVEQAFYATPEVALTNAGACVEGTGDLARAESLFRSALEFDANYAEALFRLGRVLHKRDKHFPARAFYQRFQAIAGDTAESLLLCFQIEKRLGDKDAAASCREGLLSRFPDSPEASQIEGRLTHDTSE